MTRSNVRRGALSAVAAAGVVALGLGVAAPATAAVNPDGSVTIDLLNVTDFHGALAFAPNIASQVAGFRAQLDSDVAFTSSGDNVGASTYESGSVDDAPTLDVLNAMDLDVTALGNHEFDDGYPARADGPSLQSYMADSEFPYLGANVTGVPELEPYHLMEFGDPANPVVVAFVGGVTLETPGIVNPDGIAGVGFSEPVAAVNAIARQLSDGDPSNDEADVVVALMHEDARVVAPNLSADIDAAFGGHSHTRVPNPTATPAIPDIRTNFGAPVVQSEANGVRLGHIQLQVATDGTVTTNIATTLAVTTYVPNTGQTGPYDTTVAEIVDEAYTVAEASGSIPVGTIAAPILAASRTGLPSLAITPQNRGSESPLNNMIAQSAFEGMNDAGYPADFGVMNAGGIRADLDQDSNLSITARESFNVQSFGNTIGTVDLTAAQVYEAIEQQFNRSGSRPVLALGLSDNVAYLYDPSAPVGEWVTDVYIDGVRIDEASSETFTVAGNTFLLRGGDAWTAFRDGANLTESGIPDVTITERYLAANPGLEPDFTQRGVGMAVVTDLTQAIAPGEQVEVRLSSLAFTQDSDAKPTEVVATNAATDEVLATTPVDLTRTVNPDTNETGRAAVVIAVPEGTPDGQFTVEYAFAAVADEPAEVVTLEFTVAADVVPPTEEPSPTAPTPTTPPTSAPPVAGGQGGTLPQTGADLALPAIALSALLLLAGLGLVLRRRTV